MSLDRRLAAESARVAGVLADFHLLHLFAERGAISVLPLLLDGWSARTKLVRGEEGGGCVYRPRAVFSRNADLCDLY